MRIDPDNLIFAVDAAREYIKRTGTGLAEKPINKEVWFVSHSELLADEQSLAVHLSDLLTTVPESLQYEVYGALYRTVARYSISRVRHTLQDYDALRREYYAVEKKRKRRRATSVYSPSQEFIKVCLKEAESEVEQVIERIYSNIWAFENPRDAEKLTGRAWRSEDDLADLDVVLDGLHEKLGDIAKPIVEANKEDREKWRLRVAIAALFGAVLLGSLPNMIPEASKQVYWADLTTSLEGLGNDAVHWVTDLWLQQP